jgi:microcystin-dependent protein
MTEPFVGEIMTFAGNFAPRGWAICNGAVLPIQQNTPLFSLIGTQFGGNGTTNFALPNLVGSTPMGPGQGPGLTPRTVGETGGSAISTLTVGEMPQHSHAVSVLAAPGNTVDPTGARFAIANNGKVGVKLYAAGAATGVLSGQALGVVGSGQARNNLPPFQALLFCIALEGIFPSFP